MTRAELYSLSSYAQTTLGRPINVQQCAICGSAPTDATPIAYGGLCPKCQAKNRPDQEIVMLFKPLRRKGTL